MAQRKATGSPQEGFRTWTEDGVVLFKVAEILLPPTTDNRALERSARQRAQPISAQVSYAYCLDPAGCTTWWQEWGGFDLELEIAYVAVMERTDVKGRLRAFDPATDKTGSATAEEFADVLFVEFRDRLTEKDLQRGFESWHAELVPEAKGLFERDLKAWLNPSKLAANRQRPAKATTPAGRSPRRRR
jgi:hypothetical protein